MQIDKCPEHKVDLMPTRQKTQMFCPQKGCDFHYMTPQGQGENMTKVTIPLKADKEQRKAAIDEAVKNKAKSATVPPGSKEARKQEATAPGIVKPSKAERKAKVPKELNQVRTDDTSTVTEAPTSAKDITKRADKELDATVKPTKGDANALTVSDVARELGLDPKAARAKLRRDGSRATDGRWPKVKRDSKEHAALIALLQPDAKPEPEDEEDDVAEGDEADDSDEESNEDADDEDEDEE